VFGWQDLPDQKVDQFFSGNVTEFSAEKITVERVVLGKNSEKKTFAITQATKTEGKLAKNARVTVRFTSGEDGGELALSIIVRAGNSKKN
jgi:hypothetical protein